MRGITRSIRLFRGFRTEGQDPESFYRLLGDDTVREISRYCQLTGARVIDIGGASGYVGDALMEAGASTLTVEYDWSQIVQHGRRLRHGVQGDGRALPIFDAAFDVAYSSNVLEHVTDPERMLHEMVRTVTPGGIVFVTYTNWLSPWGGHETSPWHYLGGTALFAGITAATANFPPPNTGSTSSISRLPGCSDGHVGAQMSTSSTHSLAITRIGHGRW